MASRRGTLGEGHVLVCVRARDRRSSEVRACTASRVKVQRVSRLAPHMQVTTNRRVFSEEDSDPEQLVGAAMALDMPGGGGADADAGARGGGSGGDSGLSLSACDPLAAFEAAGDALTRADNEEGLVNAGQQ